MKKLFLLVCVFLCFTVSGAYALDNTQDRVLSLAYKYGSQIHFRGDTFGETVAAIAYQETKAGAKIYQRKGIIVGDRAKSGHYKSLGPMQVQLPAARDVFRWYPEIMHDYFGRLTSPTDEEVIVALLTNTKFNIQVGAAYFRKMLEKKKSWHEAILAYNRGAANDGTDPNDYVNKVKMWRKTIVLPFLKK